MSAKLHVILIARNGYWGRNQTKDIGQRNSLKNYPRMTRLFLFYNHTFQCDQIVKEDVLERNDACNRLLALFDSPDFWRTASDACADLGWSTTKHGVDRSLHVGMKWDAPNDHDRDHDDRVVAHCSVFDDGSACTVFPGWFRGRADATSARVLH